MQRFRSDANDVVQPAEARRRTPREAGNAAEAGEPVSSLPATLPETAEPTANQTTVEGAAAGQIGEQNVLQPAPDSEQRIEHEPSRTMPARSKPEIGSGAPASASQADGEGPAPAEPLQAEQEQDTDAYADDDDLDDFEMPATRFRRRVHAEEEGFVRSAPQDGGRLDAPVTRLPSVGPSFAEKLARLGVHTVRDCCTFSPTATTISASCAPLTG